MMIEDDEALIARDKLLANAKETSELWLSAGNAIA